MYPDPDVARLVSESFVPVRVHVKDDQQEFQRLGERFGAQWTPTTLVIDPLGTEHHRIEGYLPKEDFTTQLELGLAKAAFGRNAFDEAERRFEAVLEKYPQTDAAPEAQYWAGVSRYKSSADPAALGATARRFTQRYSDSTWGKKASVWAK